MTLLLLILFSLASFILAKPVKRHRPATGILPDTITQGTKPIAGGTSQPSHKSSSVPWAYEWSDEFHMSDFLPAEKGASTNEETMTTSEASTSTTESTSTTTNTYSSPSSSVTFPTWPTPSISSITHTGPWTTVISMKTTVFATGPTLVIEHPVPVTTGETFGPTSYSTLTIYTTRSAPQFSSALLSPSESSTTTDTSYTTESSHSWTGTYPMYPTPKITSATDGSTNTPAGTEISSSSSSSSNQETSTGITKTPCGCGSKSSTTESFTTSPSSSLSTSTSSSSTSQSTSTTQPISDSAGSDSGKYLSDYAQPILEHHNLHRQNHSVPNLTWNDTLADWSSELAHTCFYQHSRDQGDGVYGQNIGAGYPAHTIKTMIDSMYNSQVIYYPSWNGDDEEPQENGHDWLHFSQIVWKASKSVGCATVDYPGGLGNVPQEVGKEFTVCNYFPPGNVVGQFHDNVLEPQGMEIVWAQDFGAR